MNQALTVGAALDLKLVPCDTNRVYVLAGGLNTFGDGRGGWWYFNSSSTTVADDISVIQVTGIPTGRWILATGTSPGMPLYYNASGAIAPPTKRWVGRVTPSTGNGYSIDISSAGFSIISNYNVIAVKNTAVANSSANVSIKSVSTSAIVVNIVEGNPATVSILGINVLSGNPLTFADVTGLTLSVIVEGY